jgi:hypothetical protein
MEKKCIQMRSQNADLNDSMLVTTQDNKALIAKVEHLQSELRRHQQQNGNPSGGANSSIASDVEVVDRCDTPNRAANPATAAAAPPNGMHPMQSMSNIN